MIFNLLATQIPRSQCAQWGSWIPAEPSGCPQLLSLPTSFSPCRKRQLSPQSKSSSKVTSVPGKGSEQGPAAAKGSKSSTLSRREELLKQLKAVEDAIARKRAKIPGKV